MPEASDKQSGAAGRSRPPSARAEAGGVALAGVPGQGVNWRALWPLPLLVVSVLLLAGGIVASLVSRPRANLDEPLVEAAALIQKDQFEPALRVLKERMLPLVDRGAASTEQEQQFFVLRARALFMAQGQAHLNVQENNQNITKDYVQAEQLGAVLEPADVIRLAETYLAQSQTPEAAQRARSLPVSEAAQRRRLLKAIVERNLSMPDLHAEQTLGLLMDLSQDAGASAADRVWTLARQAELLLADDRPQDAATKLVREMLRLEAPPAVMGELYYLLGRAYTASGQWENAEHQFKHASEALETTNPLQGEIGLMMGRLRQTVGGTAALEEAREKFAAVVADYANSPSYLPALAGLADVEAALAGNDATGIEASIEHYARVIEEWPHAPARRDLTSPLLASSLMARHADRFLNGDSRNALRYAELAEDLWSRDQTPADILLALAATRRKMADETLSAATGAVAPGPPVPAPGAGAARTEAGAEAQSGPPGSPSAAVAGAPAIMDVDQVTREEVKRHYLAAGNYYLRHARAVVVDDPAAASRSRWNAADAFDLAGDAEEAIKAFSDYVQGASDDDQRRPEAKFRLARAFQAEREYGTAAGLYTELINTRPTDQSPGTAGHWGDRSIVPLAQCYILDGTPDNDAQAEALLQSVVDGRMLSPDAAEFRAGLLELGRLYYETGRYSQAITRLEQAMARYAADRQIEAIRFWLADSYRLSAGEIERTLTEEMPASRRQELKDTRISRIKSALSLYGQVQQGLGARPNATLSQVERLHLRNSTFYVGDCAFDLGDYAAAINAYDAARLRYPGDPASLVAMVQIVNAYVAQGQWDRAGTANERARQHLERFPDSVWANPDLPMEKKHWERWLDSRILLEQRTHAAAPTTSP